MQILCLLVDRVYLFVEMDKKLYNIYYTHILLNKKTSFSWKMDISPWPDWIRSQSCSLISSIILPSSSNGNARISFPTNKYNTHVHTYTHTHAYMYIQRKMSHNTRELRMNLASFFN